MIYAIFVISAMENELHDRSVGITPDSKRREKRRTSILKPPKPRFPLQELSVLQAENELTATTTTGGRLSTSKRVSFAASQVKEFRADANVLTMWGSSYYEDIYRSSDSSHQTDSSNSDGHINPTEESTKFLEDSRHQPLQKENSSSDDKDLLEYTETNTTPELNLRFSSTLPSSLQKKILMFDDSATNKNIYSNPCSRGNVSELEDGCLQVGGTDVGSHYSPQNPIHSFTSKVNTGTSSHIERLFPKHSAAAVSDCDNDDSDDLCRPEEFFKFHAQSMSPIKLTYEVDDHVSSIPNKEMLRFEGKDVVALPDTERESRSELHCIATSSTKEENSTLSEEKKILPLYKVGSIQLSPRNVSPKASFNNCPSPIFNSSPPFPNKALFFQKSMSPSNSASFTMSDYKSGNISCQSKLKSQTSFRHSSNINQSGRKVHENDNSLDDFPKGGSSYLKNVEMPYDTIGKEKPTQEAQLIKKSLTKKQGIIFSNLQRNTLLEREGHEHLSSSVMESGINFEDSYRNMELTEAPGNIVHVNKSKYCSNAQTSGSISEFTETYGNILGRSQVETGSVTLSEGHRSSAINDRMELILCQQTQVFKATSAQKHEVQYSDSKGNDSTDISGKHVSQSVQNMRTFNCINMEPTEAPGNILDVSQERNCDQGITSESTIDFTEVGGNILCDQVKTDSMMSLVDYPSFASKDEIKFLACQQTQKLNGMFIGRKEMYFSNKGGNVSNENVRSHLIGSEDKGVLNNSDTSMELTETSRNIMDINQTKNYDKEVTPESSIEFTEAYGKIIDKNQVEVDHMSLSDENQSLSDRVNYQVLKNTSNGKQQFHASNKRRDVSLEKSKHLLGLVNTCTDSNRSTKMTEAPGNSLEINQPKNFDLSTTGNTIGFPETCRNIVNGNQVDADHRSLPKGKLLDKNVVFSEQKPVIKENCREQMIQFAQKTNVANKPAWQQHTLSPEKIKKNNGSEESMELTEASSSILVHSQTKDCDRITPDSSIEFTEACGKIIGRNETKTDHLSESADSQLPAMNIHPNMMSIKKYRIQNTQFASKARNVSIDSAGHLLVSFQNMQTCNKSDRSMEVTESSGNIIGSNQTKYFDCTIAGSTVDFTETFGLISNKNQVESEHILLDGERSLAFDNRMIQSPCQPQHLLKEKTEILHAQLSSESRNTSENARHQHLSNSSTVGTLHFSNGRLKVTDAPGCTLEIDHHITPETSIELTDAGGNIFEGNEVEIERSLLKERQSSSGDRLIAFQRTQLLTDDSCKKQEILCLNKRRTKLVESSRQQRNIALFNSSDESCDLAEAPHNILDISQTKNGNQSVTPESSMEFTKACGNVLARSQLDHVPLQKENQSFSSDEKVNLDCSQMQVLAQSLSTVDKSRHCLVETEKSQHRSGSVENASTFSGSEKYLELSDTPENILAANHSKNFSHSLTAENVIELTEAGGRVLERNEVETDLASLSAEGPSPITSSRAESTACHLNQKLMSNVEESDISSRQRLFGSDFNMTLNRSDKHMKVSDTPGNIQDGNITTFDQSESSETSMEYAEAPADTSQISSRQYLSASDESMEFTTSGGQIFIRSNLCKTNIDNNTLCDISELKDDKYRQDVAGNSLNCDKNLDDNQMSVVGAENVELTDDVTCSPVNILNHVSSGKNVSHIDASNHHIEVTTSGGRILIGNDSNATDMGNSALCNTSELKDDKFQQGITENSLNCDRNLNDNHMSAVGAENSELTEGVTCSPVNVLNRVSSGKNVGHVEVNDHHIEYCNSSKSLESPPTLRQIVSTVIDENVCVAEISPPSKKIKLCDDFFNMDKSRRGAGIKSEIKAPLSDGNREPSKVSPSNANKNDIKEVSSCSNGKHYISGLSSEENEFSTVTSKITGCVSPREMVVSESNIESAVLITDEIKIQDSYLIVNEVVDIAQPQEKAFCKNGNACSFDSDKNMELTITLSSNQVKDSSEVSVPIEVDISIQKELDFEENKIELKNILLDDDETKSVCKDQVCNSLEKNGTTNDKQEGSQEINSPKPETLKENRELVDNMTSFCKERSRNSKRSPDNMSSVSKKQQACDDYIRNANPVVELPSLPKRMLSCEEHATTLLDISESEGPTSAKRMCVNFPEDASRCDQSREATGVSEDTAFAEQMLGTATTDREVTSSTEQMCVTSLSQDTSNEHSCDVNENEDPVSAKESCISSPLQDASCSLFTEEKEIKNTHEPSTSAVVEHELAEIHEKGHTSMIDCDFDLSQENQFLLCEDNDASNKLVLEFFGKSYISGQGNSAKNSSKIHNVEACDTISLESGNWLFPLNINVQSETTAAHDKVSVNENININSRGKELKTRESDVGATLISRPVVPHTSDSASFKQQVEELEDQPSLKANNIDGGTKDSVEDLIRKSAQRKDCIWKITSLSTQEWSFEFLNGTLQLIINWESDNVSLIYIVSHTDEESSIMQLAHRYLQNKLTRDYLIGVCQTCSDVPDVLKLVEHSVKYSQEFVQSFYDLELTDTAETDGKSVTFDIANLEMHRWFYVSLDLSSWAGWRLHPEDISVKTVIGKIDQGEVRMLMKTVPISPWFLRDFAKRVHWYVEECLKTLEKPCVSDIS